MRKINLKYIGECRKCDATLDIGEPAIYERRVGVFCLGCAPTDPEKIRAYRQEAANRKADKYEGWAAKRREKAGAVLRSNRRYTEDIAFNTQPGHIPLRARVIRQNDRAVESITKAHQMEEKAKGLRHVRVAGDAERKRQVRRDAIRPLLKTGMVVDTIIWGLGKVKKINKKTATIVETGVSGDYKVNVDLANLRIVKES